MHGRKREAGPMVNASLGADPRSEGGSADFKKTSLSNIPDHGENQTKGQPIPAEIETSNCNKQMMFRPFSESVPGTLCKVDSLIFEWQGSRSLSEA